MKRKITALLMCICMGAIAVAGCGSDDSSEDDGAAAETEEEDEAEEEAEAEDSAAGGDLEGALEGVTLSVGTSGLFGPFSYYDEDGVTLIGHDIDMIYALQDLLGFEIKDGEIQAMDYSALTASTAEGKLDMAAAALCVTDERKEVMDFSDIYCDSGQKVMINTETSGDIESVDDLDGKVVAVEKGTSSHAYAEKNLDGAEIQVHDTITTAYASLEEGKVDALIQDGPGCEFYLQESPDTKLATVGEEFNQGQAPYAIGFIKGFEYVDLFNEAIDYLTENGTMAEIYEKWCE